MAPQHHVRVGVAGLVVDEAGKLVMGKRRGATLGVGQWQFPGGHLEMGETYFECAQREVLEETGLKVRAVKLVAVTNDIFSETHHYITIFILCQREDPDQEPKALEPHKCESWSWQDWQDVRDIMSRDGDESVFLPIANLLRDYPHIEALTSTGSQDDQSRVS